MRSKFFSLILFFTLFSSNVAYAKLSYTTHKKDPNTTTISISLPCKRETKVFFDSISFSADHPDITLSSWHGDTKPTKTYDTISKSNKKVFDKKTTITIDATKKESPIHDAYLYLTYQTNKNPFPQEQLIPLKFKTKQQNTTIKQSVKTKPTVENDTKAKKKKSFSFSSYISRLVKKSESTAMRIFLVFLLGLLLSLTPCIYPMIPITVGVLQSQAGSSFWRNALMALFYTCGLATTYAVLGLVAGLTGPIYGHIFSNPLFIFLLVGFLLYCAFSMLGFYQMYTPKFLQPKSQGLKKKSPFAAFMFGAASGTIASPCVSPGLALVLSIVATIGNTFLGFLLLFSFGVGLSMPLLIIGIFSSSINLLPRAGMWMEEIKKMFGILIITLCFYYLKMALPWPILLWLMGITASLCGLFYLYNAQYKSQGLWKTISNIVGFALLASSILIYSEAYQTTFNTRQTEHDSLWLTNFDQAITQAKKEKKYLFVDVWAQFCSICLSINKHVLKDPQVLNALSSYVLLSVDGTKASSEPYATLQKEYNITGFPSFFIIDPDTKKVIKQWGSELYSMPKESFAEKLNTFAH